jgi:iron-sulfur cluster assembly protein
MKLLTISPAALAQIKLAAGQHEEASLCLRLAARETPDESVDYGMGFDEEKEGDARIEFDSVTVVIAPSSQELLHGVHIDFVEIEPGKFHFIFLNPNDPHYKPPTEDDALDDLA